MKLKSSLMLAAVTMALFSSAKADSTVIINISGSTAGRSTIQGELLSTNSGGLNNSAYTDVPVVYRWYTVSGSAVAHTKCDGAIFKAVKGTTPNKTTTYVRTFWAGSASGVDYVSNQVQLDGKLLATSVDFSANTQLTGAGVVLAPASTDTVCQFGFSDVKQAATPHQTNALAEQTDMFILPFKWVRTGEASTTHWSNVTNMTGQVARNLYTTGGMMKLSRLTGDVADASTYVYACGRDNDSGTRITAMGETGTGAFATLTQYKFTVSGTAPAATLSSPLEVFDGGYASGGDLSKVVAAQGYPAIAYLGVSDANTPLTPATGKGVELTYNGVACTNANIINGKYTFWSKYQAIRKQALTGTASTIFTGMKNALIALATDTSAYDGLSGTSIKLTDMKCTRASDGAVVK